MDPTLLVDGLLGGLLVCRYHLGSIPAGSGARLRLTLIITRETVSTPYANLSAWMRLILRSVTHTRHIYQLDLVNRLHESNGSFISWVLGYAPRACTTVLGHAVP